MGQGLVLNYIFRRTFRDYNANGRIDGNAETIDITSQLRHRLHFKDYE